HHWFSTALDSDGDPPAKAFLGLLRISMEEENWDRAQEIIEALDEAHPGALEVSELAETREELRRWRESIEELERLRQEQAEAAARREAERLEREEEERLAREREAEEIEQARLAAIAEEEARNAADEEGSTEPEEPEVA